MRTNDALRRLAPILVLSLTSAPLRRHASAFVPISPPPKRPKPVVLPPSAARPFRSAPSKTRTTAGAAVVWRATSRDDDGEQRAADSEGGGGSGPAELLRWPRFVAAFAGLVGASAHGEAWAIFFGRLAEMRANSSPEEFAAALSFWMFAAVSHPILQPILWISEVLHNSPGPKIGDLVPITFAAGSMGTIYLIAAFKEIRDALFIAALSAFVTYVGAGLDGQAGLGDYNLQLDDPHNGAVVRGCPTFDQVRLPSVEGFSMEKYQGRWYWHKVHDWTQFKEMYDQTLDIRLSEDGRGYTDTLGLRGPSPKSSPLSWDKSPLANGARISWPGRVDENDPPGASRERLGVDFANFVVDVLADPRTGEYRELIQFQCIETGGVRLYEGVDFMSRSPGMSDDELAAMHSRAERAGLYPYGASPEQMIRIERRQVDEGDVDNAWQAMWRVIGVQKLLDSVG